MKTALTIAGSDCSGGAGIQADIKTMSTHGIYAMSAITALTAQNTTGVTDILESTPSFLSAQLDCIFTDIFPDAVKIGMVSSADLISVIAQKLRQYEARHVVVDPVMVATAGSRLLRENALNALETQLLPLAELVTPNIPEAEILAEMAIRTPADMETAAKRISGQYHCAVLCKGGHDRNNANDFLWSDGAGFWFRGTRIDNQNTHGTGCTLSSAIASNLAKGMELHEAVEQTQASCPAPWPASGRELVPCSFSRVFSLDYLLLGLFPGGGSVRPHGSDSGTPRLRFVPVPEQDRGTSPSVSQSFML